MTMARRVLPPNWGARKMGVVQLASFQANFRLGPLQLKPFTSGAPRPGHQRRVLRLPERPHRAHTLAQRVFSPEPLLCMRLTSRLLGLKPCGKHRQLFSYDTV